jgi:dihydrolipoamide dehydrogenase
MADYDLIVVGGGPAGYVGAIRAAQLGKKVACVEMDRAGGTCLNWGCIPTKSLLKNAEVFQLLTHHSDDFGLKVDGLKFDWSKVIGRSRKVADKLAGGIELLFKKNKIDYVRGVAAIPKAGVVEVTDKDGKKSELKGKNILVATGVVSREMPGFPFNGSTVIGSRQAMVLPEQPKDIIVIGAGAIGIEFAYFFNAFGTKVTVVEMLPNILPVEDTEVSVALEKSLTKQGLKLLAGTKVDKAEATDKGVKLTLSGKASETIEASVALVAIGVSPLLPQGVKLEADQKSWLKTNDNYETSVKGIYAAGDIIGPPWLAHVASFEAVQAVEGMFGVAKPRKVSVFPGCTYCSHK